MEYPRVEMSRRTKKSPFHCSTQWNGCIRCFSTKHCSQVTADWKQSRHRQVRVRPSMPQAQAVPTDSSYSTAMMAFLISSRCASNFSRRIEDYSSCETHKRNTNHLAGLTCVFLGSEAAGSGTSGILGSFGGSTMTGIVGGL